MDHDLTDPQLLAEREDARKGGDQILGVMLKATAEGSVSLVEDGPARLGLTAEGLRGLLPIIGQHEAVITEQRYVQGGIARVQHGVHGGVDAEAGG